MPKCDFNKVEFGSEKTPYLHSPFKLRIHTVHLWTAVSDNYSLIFCKTLLNSCFLNPNNLNFNLFKAAVEALEKDVKCVRS